MKKAFFPVSVVSILTVLAVVAMSLAEGPSHRSSQPTSEPSSSSASKKARQATSQPVDLLQARKGFVTKLLPGKSPMSKGVSKPPVPPPGSQYALIHYASPAGKLAAYLFVPRDNKKHPAVVWAGGGYGGIGAHHFSSQPAENDQSPYAFKEAGFIVMIPSWRGQNDNPGRFEMWFGEVNDALAAIDTLAKLPQVDPSHIYMVGHSTGGTMTLLTALCSKKLRAAFSIGGIADVAYQAATEPDIHPAPWDPANNKEEGRLRSAIDFVESLRTPMWFFEGSGAWTPHSALLMDRKGQAVQAPFHAFFLEGANHFDEVRPVTQLLAAKIAKDVGRTCNMQIAPAEIEEAYTKVFPGKSITAVTAVKVSLKITPPVHEAAAGLVKQHGPSAILSLFSKGDQIQVGYMTEIKPVDYVVECDGLKVMITDFVAGKWPSILLDVEAGAVVAKPMPTPATDATSKP